MLQMPKMSGGGVGGISDGLSGMSLSQSRLGIWTDKAPGSTRQGANMGPSLHSSHSTPNLQGASLYPPLPTTLLSKIPQTISYQGVFIHSLFLIIITNIRLLLLLVLKQ